MALSNSTPSQCSFAESHYQSCQPSGGNQMVYARKVLTLFDYQLVKRQNVRNFPYPFRIPWSTQPILVAFYFTNQILICPEKSKIIFTGQFLALKLEIPFWFCFQLQNKYIGQASFLDIRSKTQGEKN